MPSLITTIEDNSPLITYSSDWKTGSSADNQASLYSGSSFTYTNTSGATATFAFNGTGIEIFGSKRGNHGLYQVKVDDMEYPPVNGSVADPGEFQQSLFSVNDLNHSLHYVTLTNQENSFVDIDFITWQTKIGSDNEQLHVDTFEDSDASFTYFPADSYWTKTPNNLGTYLGGSGHATNTPGAVFYYTFKGDGVALIGPVSPNGAPYTVQVDGGMVKNYSSVNAFYTPHSTLYHADSLGPGKHRLKLAYMPEASDQVFSIDYATVYSSSFPASSNSKISTAAGPIAGAVIPGVILLLILFCWLFRRYRGRRRLRKKYPGGNGEVDMEAYRHLNNRSGTLIGSAPALSALSHMTTVTPPFMDSRTLSLQTPFSPLALPSPPDSPPSPPVRVPSPPPPPSPASRESWNNRRNNRLQQMQSDNPEGSTETSGVIIGRPRSNSAPSARRVRLDLPDEPEPVQLSRPDPVFSDSVSELLTTRSRANSTTSLRNSSSPKTSPFPLPSRSTDSPVPSLIDRKIPEEPMFGRSALMYPNHPQNEKQRADKFYYI